MATICDRCGRKAGFFDTRIFFGYHLSSGYICGKCTPIVEKEEWEKKRESGLSRKEREEKESERQRLKQLKQAADKMIVTTTPSVDGYHVRKYLGVESVEYVIGTGIFSEITTDFADIFGRRSSAFERKLQTAKRTPGTD